MEQFNCSKCVMDKSDPDIKFTGGICNHCLAYIRNEKLRQEDLKNFDKYITRIKKDGQGRKYDVLLGMSGGVDSSMCLHHLVELGLRPLCYSIDNGWQDPKADENIMRLVEGLKVPFYRYTIDLDKFRELQGAFIMSGTANIEIPTDHILMASSYEMARKYGIKWIISGGNLATENVMPVLWGYQASDLRFIKSVYKKHMGKRLKGLPLISWLGYNWNKWILGINTLYLLDFFTYNRNEAVQFLTEKYGYQGYGDKHCESVFTNWFQNFYLYEKFGYDKRKPHLSSLINSGQMTREEAMKELEKNPEYPQLGLENRIKDYPIRTYKDYPNSEWLWNLTSKVIRNLRKWKF